MIGQALEQAEVADVLVGQNLRQVLKIFGHVVQIADDAGDFGEDAVVEVLDVRPLQNAQVAQIEEAVHRVLVARRVVVDLAVVLDGRSLQKLLHIADQRVRVVGQGRQAHGGARRPDDVDDRQDENGVMCGQGAARLGDDDRVRRTGLLAGLEDRIDDRVGVLLQAVVSRGVKRGARPVVIDRQPAPDVQIPNLDTEFAQLHIRLRRLAHRRPDLADVGHLRADVTVHHLQRVEHPELAQPLGRADHLGRAEPELGVVAP